MTENKNDGGQAFPSDRIFDPADWSYLERPQSGMSLRDWFAGMALQGFMLWEQKPESIDEIEVMAGRMYDVADAMLKAREK